MESILFVSLFLTSVVVHPYPGQKIIQSEEYKNILFIIGISFILLALGYVKYFNYFVDNIGALVKGRIVVEKIILTLGFAFFTF